MIIPNGRSNLLPVYGGVYLVIARDRVVYVGESGNLRRRWQSHHLKKQLGRFEIAWVRVDDGQERIGIETMLMLHFRPRYNHILSMAVWPAIPRLATAPPGWILLRRAAQSLRLSSDRLRSWLYRAGDPNLYANVDYGLSRRLMLAPELVAQIGLSRWGLVDREIE